MKPILMAEFLVVPPVFLHRGFLLIRENHVAGDSATIIAYVAFPEQSEGSLTSSFGNSFQQTVNH